MNQNNPKSPKMPPFRNKDLKQYIGKRLLIGLTYYEHDGTFLEQKQMHGIISQADEKKGFTIILEGIHEGKIFTLPPDTRSFKKAPPGEYREYSTGEVVVNPDLLCSWEVTKPASRTK